MLTHRAYTHHFGVRKSPHKQTILNLIWEILPMQFLRHKSNGLVWCKRGKRSWLLIFLRQGKKYTNGKWTELSRNAR